MVRNSNSTALGFYERLGYDDDEVAILSRRFDDLSDQAGRSD
jgi:ribosomal protein S18 acetylase RimI-like enzyme